MVLYGCDTAVVTTITICESNFMKFEALFMNNLWILSALNMHLGDKGKTNIHFRSYPEIYSSYLGILSTPSGVKQIPSGNSSYIQIVGFFHYLPYLLYLKKTLVFVPVMTWKSYLYLNVTTTGEGCSKTGFDNPHFIIQQHTVQYIRFFEIITFLPSSQKWLVIIVLFCVYVCVKKHN